MSTSNPRNEIRLSHLVDPGDAMVTTTGYQLRNTIGGSPDASRIAYTVISAFGATSNYVAEISATPNPRPLGGSGPFVRELRPDNGSVLLEAGSQILEAVVDSAQAPQFVCEGLGPHYDSTGDVVLTQVLHEIPPDNIDTYLTVGAAFRSSFGTAQHVGTPGLAAPYVVTAAADRAVVLMGEGSQTTPRTENIHIALANDWARDKLLYLADFLTPLDLKGSRAQVIDP